MHCRLTTWDYTTWQQYDADLIGAKRESAALLRLVGFATTAREAVAGEDRPGDTP